MFILKTYFVLLQQQTYQELPDEDGGELGEGEEAEVEEHVAREVLHVKGARDVEIVVHNPDHGHVEQNPGDKIHLLTSLSESKPGQGQGVSFLKIEVFINISLIFKSNVSSGEHFSKRAQYYHVKRDFSPNYPVVTELFI